MAKHNVTKTAFILATNDGAVAFGERYECSCGAVWKKEEEGCLSLEEYECWKEAMEPADGLDPADVY